MPLVDFIDLDDDECYFKVDVIDLSTDEDSVKKDGNFEEEEEDNVAQSENLAEAATPTSEQVAAAATSLSMVDNGSTMSSLMADKSMQPENQDSLLTNDVAKEATRPGNRKIIAAGDCVGEAMQSECEAGLSSSMIEQAAATSLLLKKQGAITSSLKEDKSTHSGNHVFVAALDCAEVSVKHATEWAKSEVLVKHAQEEPQGDTDKDENCVFEAETVIPSPPDKENKTSSFWKFYSRKEKKQVNISATECNRQLSILHTKGVSPTLHYGDSGSVAENICNGTASIGINVLDGKVVMSTYQECNKTFQGNATCEEVHDSGSKGCRFQGCTNGAHGGTPLCIFHNSRPQKRCCAVPGCTKRACKGSQGCTDRCVKHGGGKRCKYDGCGKGAQGNTDFCIAHGGGRRCKFQGCRKSAQGRSDYCVKHGGGRRCTFQGCRKSAIGRSDYCIRHGGGRRCKFLGCNASAICESDFCSMHRTSLSSGNNSDREAPTHQAKKAEPSKRTNSHSVIGGRSQKRQNANDYVNTVVETGERKGRVIVCQDNMLKAQINSESGHAAGSPSLQLVSDYGL